MKLSDKIFNQLQPFLFSSHSCSREELQKAIEKMCINAENALQFVHEVAAKGISSKHTYHTLNVLVSKAKKLK